MEVNVIDLNGLFPPLATPYQEDKSLDETALRDIVKFLLPDVDGLIVNGTTGDFPLLSRAERRRAVAVVIDAANGAKPVFAGTGAPSTREAIALTQDAQDAGVDAVMIVAPYYLRPSAAGLLQHFSAIAAQVPDLPIILYNFPQLVGQPIPVEVVRRLRAEHPNIVGMKDTSGDLTYMLHVLEVTDAAFQVLVGRGTVVVAGLAAGAVGAVLADANLIPAKWQELLAAARAGEWETARAKQYALQPLTRIIGKGASLVVRAGLDILGHPIGPPRPPLTYDGVLEAEDLAALREFL
jgi:4-hydroxy-tetrahydrodipicolinate synthase